MTTTTRRHSVGSCVWAGVASLCLTVLSASVAHAQASIGYVVGNNGLIPFDITNPTALQTPIALTGLTGGDTLVAIDFRPQNGQLYGLGFNSGAGTVTLYHIDHQTGVATALGPSGTFVAANGVTPVPVAGAAFGFDFNPVLDRVRVVTSAGQNFRMNPDTGAFVDGDLGIGTQPGLNMDGAINGPTTFLHGAAYTNNQPNAAVTTLYTLSASTKTLYIQNPPNGGTQTTAVTVRRNGNVLDFGAVMGFDILPNVTAPANNAVTAGTGVAALFVGTFSELYTIDLMTGAATFIGPIGSGGSFFRGFAVQVPPAPSGTDPSSTVVTASPDPAHLGETVVFTAFVTPSTATGLVTFRVDGNVIGTGNLIRGLATTSTAALTVNVHQVTATYEGSSTLAPSTSPAVSLSILPPGTFQQYFAEGATGFFQTNIGVVNASATNVAHVTVSVFPETSSPLTLLFQLDPLTRRTIDLNGLLGTVEGVSTLVEADQRIGAMRQMTWGTPVYGSTLESGISTTSTSWYFAEGATNVFSLFYLVENPGPSTATVTLTHLREGGGAPVVQNEEVPGFSRRTVFINAVPGLEGESMSTVITSSQPIVAERAMYLNTTARLWEGGHAGRGATGLSPTWSFAEGATGSFFHTYLLLGNPNATEATVTVQYLLPDGTTVTKQYAVAGESRRTVDVNVDDPQLAATSVGMTIASTQPIVAERAMWWGTPFFEGSGVLGSTQSGTLWAIGEVAEGGPAREAAFILVSNASATTGTVRMTVVYDDETREHKDYTLLGSARLTVRLADDFSKAVGQKVSVLAESLSANVPITVEVSRYQSPLTFGDAGGAALATRIR